MRDRGQGGGDLTGRERTLSRAMSLILRHQGHRAGVTLNPVGFAKLSEVLAALKGFSRIDVLNVARRSTCRDGRRRFELIEFREGGQDPLIRATHGHTIAGVGVDEPPGPEGGRAHRSRSRSPRNTPEYSIALSRALSKVLRHEGSTATRGSDGRAVIMYDDGSVPIGDLTKCMRRFTPRESDILLVVRCSRHRDGTPRFECIKRGREWWVRALEKHTIPGLRPEDRAG